MKPRRGSLLYTLNPRVVACVCWGVVALFVQDARKAAKYGRSSCDAFVTDYATRVRASL